MKKNFLTLVCTTFCMLLIISGCLFSVACSQDKSNDKTSNNGKSEFASGNGTTESPYIIDKDYQWLNVSKYPDACFELAADINLGDYDSISPTGTADAPFTGTFNGKNHTIAGAKVLSAHNTGLFGVVSGANIKNLTFTNSTVRMLSGYNDGEFMGSFASIVRKGSIIENCHTKNVSVSFPSKTSYFTFAGGFVGSVESVSSIIYCSCDVKITLSSGDYPGFYVGGFAERVSGSTIDCCTTTGSISFDHYAATYVMDVSTFVNRVVNSNITNMLAEMDISVGPNIDVYTIAGTVDEETLKYCLNFCTYQRKTKGRYKSCKLYSNASEDYNIYFSSSQYSYANDTLDKSLWVNNKFWKKGTLHPELISYEDYLEVLSES